MQIDAISHRCFFAGCYPSEQEIVINLLTGKDADKVFLVQEDPYIAGISGRHPWEGVPVLMRAERELERNILWSAVIRPKYRRLQYYFEIAAGSERARLFEDRLYMESEWDGMVKEYFKFPWLHQTDVFRVPEWVKGTVWYQIMPDRFARGNAENKRMPLREWGDEAGMQYGDFYGGDLRGIIGKLPYLRGLGITGIYLTPIFRSASNHKYNTDDYEQIDPDFGDEADLKELVSTAHRAGIRVMLDAVFNHCGRGFAQWQDVVEKGERSPYFDWFFVQRTPVEPEGSTKDGRFYSFAFESGMPKLNTENPEVAAYLTGLCRKWVGEWQVDGLRFDVGNEISHSFIKGLRRELKRINPEVFLLGEIWHDASPWLLGDEYDGVMDYPFLAQLQRFWEDKNENARQLMYGLNRLYARYPRTVEPGLMRFLDSHDTIRAGSRCENMDAFFGQLALLLTMPGTPCIYYGTELAMKGERNPYNRRCMPWEEIAQGKYDGVMKEVAALIRLRKEHSQAVSGEVRWEPDARFPRLVRYKKTDGDGAVLSVWIEAGEEPVPVRAEGKVLYSRKFADGILSPGGILIMKQEAEGWNR